MKTQKYLAEKAMQLIAFFSSITGMISVMSMIILVNALMDGFAVGKIFGARMEEYADSNIHWWSFGFGFVITLCLSISIVVSCLTHRINTSNLEGASKQIGKDKNQDLTKLSTTLCNFSIIISLMSVGIFMFDGVSFEQLKVIIKTPIFYCQVLMFFCIAVGVPKSIVRFSKFIYIKHFSLIDKLNAEINQSINEMIDKQFAKEEKQSKQDDDKVISLFDRLNNRKNNGTNG